MYKKAGSEDTMSCIGIAQGEGLGLEFSFKSSHSLV